VQHSFKQSAHLIGCVTLNNGVMTMPIIPSVSQSKELYLQQAFISPQPIGSMTIADALLAAVGVGVAIFLAAEGLRAIVSEPRDTYRYIYVHKGRRQHGGITNDLDRREQEHRARWRGGTIHQVGRRVTRRSALAWERKHGF